MHPIKVAVIKGCRSWIRVKVRVKHCRIYDTSEHYAAHLCQRFPVFSLCRSTDLFFFQRRYTQRMFCCGKTCLSSILRKNNSITSISRSKVMVLSNIACFHQKTQSGEKLLLCIDDGSYNGAV